jgi:23S rRNA pseudouridine955/2504/2580 synthase
MLTAGSADAGQRIDNFLMRQLKGVPRTRIYRALRKGEVRVNGSRTRPAYQLAEGDQVRIPPIRHSVSDTPVVPDGLLDHVPTLYQDEHLLVVNKPAGLAVHGGTGMAYGLVEALRHLRPELGYVELAHRLDRETSGCLMLALNRPALVGLQRQLVAREGVRKHYLALVRDVPENLPLVIEAPLRPVRGKDGHRRVLVLPDGQPAQSGFRMRQCWGGSALLEVELFTGRMHQARVHAAHMGHPIAGDRLYGDERFNTAMRKSGLGRLFLHAERLRVQHPVTGIRHDFYAPLPEPLEQVLARL